MPYRHPRIRRAGQVSTKEFACPWFAQFGCRFAARFLLPMACCATFALPAFSQDSASLDKEFYGNGAVITVTVHDGSGEPISSAAMVKLIRDGSIPSGQLETQRGSAVFVVTSLGEFDVVVFAPGYKEAHKDVSLLANGRAQVDIYLRRTGPGNTAGVPGKPLLAPEAKEAVDRGLLALSTDKMGEAEKYVGKAVRLAPQHPDVLYVEGVLSLKQRNWAQAQSALEKATQIDPNHARAFAALGMALCDQGKYDAAVAPLEKSLQLDAAAPWETRWALAKAYYQRQQYEDALKLSQQALGDSKGKAPEVGLLVAQSLTAVGRYEDAAQILREFLKEHGDLREAATARRWLAGLAANGKIRAN
ncbi:MAG TPA: tetratricopeptide repeat protein [Candidatus Angelobacter sp.]|nr:tetratricopeptide repeat protein [Candidatus Angelobacter sp.]